MNRAYDGNGGLVNMSHSRSKPHWTTVAVLLNEKALTGQAKLAELHNWRSGRVGSGVQLRTKRDIVTDAREVDWTTFPASEAMEAAALQEDGRALQEWLSQD